MKIISIFLSIIFAIDGFFLSIFTEKKVDITATDSVENFYIDGESESGTLRFGVKGGGNLFEPNEKITGIIECRDASLDGTRMKVSISSEEANFCKKGYTVLNSEKPFYTFNFLSEKNGIFTIEIGLISGEKFSYKIGIIPKNNRADDTFYYGIQPYTTRALRWGKGHQIPNFGAEETIDKILDTAEYLGINLVREDFVSWAAMQPSAGAELNFKEQDYLLKKVTDRGMKYNWILGNNAGLWSLNKNYLDSYDASRLWACPPDEELWDDFVTKLAAHYGRNRNILWEIWNEPNWGFFLGTNEEYFTLLENTAKILRANSRSVYIYSGGLALAEREEYAPFYEKASALMATGLIDNFGFHNHNGIKSYYDDMKSVQALAKNAGITKGGINSESGIPNADAATIACKALYTRSVGADGYVSFSFRKSVIPDGDVNDFAFFDEYLQPSNAVISFSTVIRFLGNARLVDNLSDEKNLIIDEYEKDGKKILVYYSLGKDNKAKAPEGEYEAFDMYGNPLKINKKFKVTNEPVYFVYD